MTDPLGKENTLVKHPQKHAQNVANIADKA